MAENDPQALAAPLPSIGAAAPDFTLAVEPGGTLTLASLRGRAVVLYFYPKDSTPGCTTESCDFRDRTAALTAAGAVVFGISRDSLKSHATFRAKQSLDFPLLSDPDGAVHRAYGAWGEKSMYGRKSIGAVRTTVLIDAQGNVARVWSPVKVPGHAEAVLQAVRALSAP
ncbi:MAG: peroxiredoxin [Bradymonadia bacterium]